MHLPLIAMALCLIPGRPTTSPVADIERMRSEFAHAVELLDRSKSESLARLRATPEYQQSAAELEQLQRKLQATTDSQNRKSAGEARGRFNLARQELLLKTMQWETSDPQVQSAKEAVVAASARLAAAEREARETEARAAAVRTAEEHAAREARRAAYRQCLETADKSPNASPAPAPAEDEISISALKTRDSIRANESFVVSGLVRTSDYYSAPYAGARKTHYSLLLSGAGSGARDEFAHVYQSIDLGDDVVKALAGASRCMRLRVRVRRPGSDAADALELLDWQFLMPDGKSFTAWATEVSAPLMLLTDKPEPNDR